MPLKQISVFLKNRSGRISEVTKVLAQANVNIRAVSISDTADFGILRLIVNNLDIATAALNNAGLTTKETKVLGIEIEDIPGALANLMELFKNNSVNIEYLYTALHGKCGKVTIILKLEDFDKGEKIVQEHNLKQIKGF